MTWEWSHTAEAYRDAEINLRNLPIDELRTIWAEWQAHDGCLFDPGFNQDEYDRAIIAAERFSAQDMADDIWSKASELRSCTPGGHLAYLCPYGCDPHLVAFNTINESGNDYC